MGDQSRRPRDGPLRVAVTGTPGVGKTTATERVDTELDVFHLNDVIREEGLYDGEDQQRSSVVADMEAVAGYLDDRADVLFESHLAHQFAADRVIVLRCCPEVIESRLRDRGEGDSSARENAEAEALDVILGEAVERHGRDTIYEIDATDMDPDAVAAEIEAVVGGERAPAVGDVSFIDYLEA